MKANKGKENQVANGKKTMNESEYQIIVQMCEKVYSNFPRFVVAHVGMRG